MSSQDVLELKVTSAVTAFFLVVLLIFSATGLFVLNKKINDLVTDVSNLNIERKIHLEDKYYKGLLFLSSDGTYYLYNERRDYLGIIDNIIIQNKEEKINAN